MDNRFLTVEDVIQRLSKERYVADRALATVLFLSHRLEKPLFLEGEPGVGKTEVAIVMARIFDTELIRLQCYEGLDASTSLYEWNYPKQLLHIRMLEQKESNPTEVEQAIYDPRFLIRRPLLEAIMRSQASAPVLLIDEIDRSDEEFEAFLLEVLSDFQITIPEIGTVRAVNKPMVVVTSNRTRDVHDALKRRCLYHWIDYPDFEKEYSIVTARIPEMDKAFAARVTSFMQRLRKEEFLKRPGISETLDWARALLTMGRKDLSKEVVEETLGCLLKYQEDLAHFKKDIWADGGKRAAYI